METYFHCHVEMPIGCALPKRFNLDIKKEKVKSSVCGRVCPFKIPTYVLIFGLFSLCSLYKHKLKLS